MQTIRVFFSKCGEAAYISHLDLQRVMSRAFRRSGLPVWYSQGFNPHIYMSFSLPLPLMQESMAESVDFKTEEETEDFSAFLAPLNEALPRGITATRIAPAVHKAAEMVSAVYTIRWPHDTEKVQRALQSFQHLEKALVVQKRKRTEETIDLKQSVTILGTSTSDGFTIKVPAGSPKNMNPAILTAFFEELSGLPAVGAQICREKVLLEDGTDFE